MNFEVQSGYLFSEMKPLDIYIFSTNDRHFPVKLQGKIKFECDFVTLQFLMIEKFQGLKFRVVFLTLLKIGQSGSPLFDLKFYSLGFHFSEIVLVFFNLNSESNLFNNFKIFFETKLQTIIGGDVFRFS